MAAERMTPSTSNGSGGESTADLLRHLSEQTSALVRDELELARVELTQKGKRAGLGAGMLSGAAVAALFMLGALTATGIAALDLAVDTWLAALIVTVIWGVIAAVLALTGKEELTKAVPPVPEASVASVKQDVQTTKTRAKEGRA